MLHAISLAIALSLLWLLLSGFFTVPLLLALGLASVIGVVLIAHRMEVVDHEGHPVHLTWHAVIYWPWLIKEIALANIDIAKAILRLPGSIEPSVFTVTASQKSELGRVVYANSITLTPGTVTIALEENAVTVHALTSGSRQGVETGEMDRRVTKTVGEA